ncbi:MAG: hypothetical protein CM15mP62_08050 [Rhodospirillaceae bacterium]|nr:MAG: hypothetical protein CM15mP62_08050 [Rhodospirillaceae bacterium]
MSTVKRGNNVLRYGEKVKTKMTSLPTNQTNTKLGLVIDLDICVGCHACAVNCKEWNAGVTPHL